MDGESLRAVLGSVDAGLCVVAAALAVVAAAGGDWLPVVSSGALFAAIVAISLFNAFAGLCAAVAFAAPIVAFGNATLVEDLRALLGISVLFISMPLLAIAIRPLRRAVTDGWSRFDRFADYLIIPVFLGVTSMRVFSALNALSGLELVNPSQLSVMKYTVMAATVGRMALEDTAQRLFPARKQEVAMTTERGPGLPVQYGTLAVKASVYLLVAVPFFGLSWRTWVMTLLAISIPLLVTVWPNVPNVPAFHRWFPRGLLLMVIMIVLMTNLAGALFGDGSDPERIRTLAVWMLVPPVVCGVMAVTGRQGGDWRESIWKRIAGSVVWLYFTLLMLGFVSP